MHYESHPLADIFPVMSPNEMTEFVKDIKAAGLLAPIVLFEGKILDGRHRFEACQIAGIEPRFEKYGGADALEYVISANLARRHLTVGQRAVIADKVANLPLGFNQHSASKTSKTPAKQQKEGVGIPTPSQKEAAERIGVSRESVSIAHKVATASPELAKQVGAGTISLHKAEKVVDAAKAKPDPVAIRDETDFLVPTRLHHLWARSHEAVEMMQTISNWRRHLKKMRESQDPLWRHVSPATVEEAFATIYGQFRCAIPYAVCPACHGLDRPKCAQCKATGFVSEFLWNQTVPHEVKDLRAAESKVRKAQA